MKKEIKFRQTRASKSRLIGITLIFIVFCLSSSVAFANSADFVPDKYLAEKEGTMKVSVSPGWTVLKYKVGDNMIKIEKSQTRKDFKVVVNFIKDEETDQKTASATGIG